MRACYNNDKEDLRHTDERFVIQSNKNQLFFLSFFLSFIHLFIISIHNINYHYTEVPLLV